VTAGHAARAAFWLAVDEGIAEAHRERWDAVVAVLERSRLHIRAEPRHFTSTRMSLERRKADHLLALAYAHTGRPDRAWDVLDAEPVGDLLDDRLPAVDHSGAAMEGLGGLLALFLEALGTADPPPEEPEPSPPRAQQPGTGLLRILLADSTLFLLLRTVDADGRPTVHAVRRAFDSHRFVAAGAAFSGAVTNSTWALIKRSWDLVSNESTAVRKGVEDAFAGAAAQLREPMADLLGGRGLRSIGLCDDGQLNQFPFEAVADDALDGDCGVYFKPPFPVRTRPSASPRPRVLLVAFDRGNVEPENDVVRADVDVALLSGLDGIDLTVMSAADHAKRDVLAAMADDYAIVHFACHGRFDPLEPRRSALLLSTAAADVLHQDSEGRTRPEEGDQRYVITMEDVQRTRLRHAPLVSLFACSSASYRSPVGIGYAGLPGAFLRSGASAVIGARWKVSARLCNDLTARMYEAVGRGVSPAEAYFAARRSVSLPTGPTVYDRGAFCFIGDAAQEAG
jgi:hypothetical protein